MNMSHYSRKNRKYKNNKSRKLRQYKLNKYVQQSKKDMGLSLSIAGSLVGASAITQGSELQDENQQAQQADLMFGGKGGVGRRKPGCVNDIADHILCFLELLNTIKIYHWSTLSYPTHKATDELHEKLSTLVDSFIEIYIGHCSRGKGAGAGAGAGVPTFHFGSAKDASISFCECKSLDAFCKVLDDNIVHLEGLTERLNGYTDLVNIRDEMVGALAKTLYLLRLK
jgi:hypothetical protein